MHGRVKVRSTEEEKLRKEQERQKKLILFRNVMEKIQCKRKEGDMDKELLEYTAQLLTANPDIYTLWNIRREVLQILRRGEDNNSELSKIYDSELQLTEYCLKVNPKSYCAWHQREWVLTTRADPDWKKELNLCNIYLKLDERNFHTWDYRRFVVSQYKTPLEDEFNYTTEKIHDNFSNYSAWHYRSKMLVQLYPDDEGGRPIADAHHKNELEMVQNAAFTDPDDTSAWFYQRWLLGAVKKIIKIVTCSVNAEVTTVAFNTVVGKCNVASAIHLYIDGVEVRGEWAATSGKEYDTVFTLNHERNVVAENLTIRVEYIADGGNQVLDCKQIEPGRYVGKSDVNFRNSYSKPVFEELRKQLDSCYQLLELEPDSKWTLLTTTVLMHCCDPVANQKEALVNLKRLKEIDTMRSGYYGDVASKWIMEEFLQKYGNCIEASPPLNSSSKFKITSLYHMQYFSTCIAVDLSNLHLTSRALPTLSALQNCKVLNLENNLITSLRNFPHLPLLRQLILRGNIIEKCDLQCYLASRNEIEILL